MPLRRRRFVPVVVSICWIAIGVATSAVAACLLRPSLHSHQARTGPTRPTHKATPARRIFERDLDSLAATLDRLESAIARGEQGATERAFAQSRLGYKRVESLLAYYSPTVAGQ